MKDAERNADIAALLDESGGSYAAALGIDLDGLHAEALFRWLIAAVLYGAPISETLASLSWHELARCDILTPQRMLATGWDGLVQMLDRGGYTRYDYKTATKLLDLSRSLLADYGDDLNALHAAATGPADLEQRLVALAKGIGPTTANIFLRELRGRWGKAEPPLSPLALAAAQQLGFVPEQDTPDNALGHLQTLWQHNGQPAETFREFETALVRAGLRLRHSPLRSK